MVMVLCPCKMMLIQNISLCYLINVTSTMMELLTNVKPSNVLLSLKTIGEMNIVQNLNMSIVTVHIEKIKYILIESIIHVKVFT